MQETGRNACPALSFLPSFLFPFLLRPLHLPEPTFSLPLHGLAFLSSLALGPQLSFLVASMPRRSWSILSPEQDKKGTLH